MLSNVNWSEVGAIAAIVAVIEAPMLLVVTWGIGWVRDVNRRLARIESRAQRVRHDDPPGYEVIDPEDLA